jgi:hypothetical protein
MDNETITKLEKEGLQIKTLDYEIIVTKNDKQVFIAQIMKRATDKLNNHQPFSDDEVENLIEDIKDLDNWRNFKELNKKIFVK